MGGGGGGISKGGGGGRMGRVGVMVEVAGGVFPFGLLHRCFLKWCRLHCFLLIIRERPLGQRAQIAH
jgi:hypothetical protein